MSAQIKTSLTLDKAKYQEGLKAAQEANKRFRSSVKGTSRRLKSFGRQATTVGRSLTKSITLPLVAAGAAAVRFASTFEDKAAQVRSTANLTAAETDSLKDSVKDVASSTGESFDSIFDSMQKAVSGSLDLAQSQELVAQAAKATAAGFGNMEKLVDVSTTAFDLFTGHAESAGEILDQIATAAQNTQVNVEDLAPAFSRGAATAANLNINQNELLATLSVVAERMGDTLRAGRANAQMLDSLQKPTTQAADVIDQLFGSVDNLQAGISEDFIGTLQELQKRLVDNNMGLQDVFASSQALGAAQVLLSDSGERAADVLKQQADASGAVDRAFERSESFMRKLRRSWIQLQVALIPIGEIIVDFISPELDRLSGIVSAVSDRFTGMSEQGQRMTVIMLGVAAAIGPIIWILGTLATSAAALLPIFAGLAAATGPIVLTGVAIAGVIATVQSLRNEFRDKTVEISDDTATWKKEMAQHFDEVNGAIDDQREKVNFLQNDWFDLITPIKAAMNFLGKMAKGMADTHIEARIMRGAFEGVDEATIFLKNRLKDTELSVQEVVQAFRDGGSASDEMQDKLRDAEVNTQGFTRAIALLGDNTEKSRSKLQIMLDGLNELNSSFRNTKKEAEETGDKVSESVEKIKSANDENIPSAANDLRNLKFEFQDLTTEADIAAGKYSVATATMAERSENNIRNAAAQWTHMGDVGEVTGDRMVKVGELVDNAINQLAVSAANSMGNMIQALVAGEESTHSVFGTILLLIADFMDNLGKTMVATAVASEIFQNLLLSNPVAAAAAGVALIAGAAVVRGLMQKNVGSEGGGGDMKVPKMAKGGIVTSETLLIAGEAGDEAIIPLDRMPEIMNSGGEKQDINISVTGKLSGESIKFMLDKITKRLNRTN